VRLCAGASNSLRALIYLILIGFFVLLHAE
jgi:hypothetical protein